ncbi:hypothetical protein LCGC14_1269590 [marine sediment metagenome]|uniref:Uncharacterized protein n=1 Tax=marine sediment metagenome TaxID=412755 RepID=A0A0F9KYG2_9ZZZZ
MKKEKDILFTRKFYPEKAKKGWLFFCFRYRNAEYTEGYTAAQIVEEMGDWYVNSISHCREIAAYLDTGEKRKDLYPIFVEIKKRKILEMLGAIRYPYFAEVNRFEIMDL